MKYSCEIIINLLRERVIELFDNPDNISKWQPGLQSFECLSGEPGQPGAKSTLVYDMNGHRVEVVEIVVARNLLEEFSGTYEAKSAPGIGFLAKFDLVGQKGGGAYDCLSTTNVETVVKRFLEKLF